MVEFYENYTIDTKWFLELSKKIGGKLIDNRLLIIPKTQGNGEFYLTEIIPGISIVLMDVVYTTQVLIKRLKSEEDLYILQYDISDEVNPIIVEDGVKNKDTLLVKSTFSIMSNQVANSFSPIIGKRVLVLRLIVDKKILNDYIEKGSGQKKGLEEIFTEEILKDKINCLESDIVLYDKLDSKSMILIHSIKQKTVFDIDIDLFLKGIGLKLLGNFIDSYTTVSFSETTVINKEAILNSKKYLLENLYGQFPSIIFLAKMAGMSVSKYKLLFKNICGDAPNQFFIREKLMLASTLLKSKEFTSICEVVNLLQYPRNSYFTAKYLDFFGKKPTDDFVSKDKNDYQLYRHQPSRSSNLYPK